MRKNLNACLHPCDAAPVSAVIPAACEIQRYQIFCYTWIESCAVYDLTDLILHSIFMYEKLKQVLVEEMSINPDDIKPDAELINDLGFNSLELADLVVLCEEKFDIVFKDADLPGLLTVRDVVDYLEANA